MTQISSFDPILELCNVGYSYYIKQGLFQKKKELIAVDDVSLTLMPGQTLGIVGESGCGKTTLSRLMTRLLRPKQGQVKLFGRSIDDYSRLELSRLLQIVFQDPYSSLNPKRVVIDAVAQPLLAHKICFRAEANARALELLDMVGLSRSLAHRHPAELSGGQRQRVVIARALALSPKILICDEPTSALDVSVQSQILNLLMDLQQSQGLSYVFISHNLAVVEHICSSVAVMYLGNLIECAETDVIFSRARHPYTEILVESILTPDTRQKLPEARLLGQFPRPTDRPAGCAFHPRCPEAQDVCRTLAPTMVDYGNGRAACLLMN